MARQTRTGNNGHFHHQASLSPLPLAISTPHSFLCAFSISGMDLGSVISLVVSPQIVKRFGWYLSRVMPCFLINVNLVVHNREYVFVIFGSISLLWVLLFWFLGARFCLLLSATAVFTECIYGAVHPKRILPYVTMSFCLFSKIAPPLPSSRTLKLSAACYPRLCLIAALFLSPKSRGLRF